MIATIEWKINIERDRRGKEEKKILCAIVWQFFGFLL